MGLGTFIAGQAISTVRRAGNKGRAKPRTLSAAESRALQQREAKEIRLAVQTIIQKTPLIHPDLAEKVDLDYWQMEMGLRLKKFRNLSEALVLTPVIALFLYGLFAFWPDGPDSGLWSFLGAAAISASVLGGLGVLAAESLARNFVARSVRKEFAAEGFDVGELMLKGAVLARAKAARQSAASKKEDAEKKAKLKRERFGK